MNSQQHIQPEAKQSGRKVFSKEFEELIAHELLTPLSSIMGFAEMMADDAELPPERCREFARIIMREGKRLSQIVDLIVLHSSTKDSVRNKQYEHDLSEKQG